MMMVPSNWSSDDAKMEGSAANPVVRVFVSSTVVLEFLDYNAGYMISFEMPK